MRFYVNGMDRFDPELNEKNCPSLEHSIAVFDESGLHVLEACAIIRALRAPQDLDFESEMDAFTFNGAS